MNDLADWCHNCCVMQIAASSLLDNLVFAVSVFHHSETALINYTLTLNDTYLRSRTVCLDFTTVE